MSYDSDVINATSGRGEANWDLFIKLCNRIRDSVGPTSMSQAMGSVLRRVKHSDPNVQLQALTLLEACVSNCGKSFQSELTKPTFQGEFKSIITGSYADPRVTQRCKELLVSWATEFKNESSMSGLVKFVEQLRKDGISFQNLQQTASSAPPSSQAVSASNEDEDLRKAIQMSLKDSNPAPAPTSSTSSSLYPSMPTRTSPSPTRKKALKKARAIYDFEAAEDNELSFRAGEIVTVLDDSDENWWRGETQLGTGLFPASFVSTNLRVDPEPSQQETKAKKKGKSQKAKGSKSKGHGDSKVNVEKIGLLLDMIKKADVTSEDNLAENETLVELEDECKKMRPVIEERIAALQKKEDEMKSINQKFEEALSMYRKLLAEGPRLSTVSQQQQQHVAPTPATAAAVAPPTQQHPPFTQYSTPHPLPPPPPQQQQQQLAPQQSSTISNPPPYFPPSGPPSSGGTMPSLSSLSSLSLADSTPSLPLTAPSMPPGYQGNNPGLPTTEHYSHALQNNMPTSLSVQALQPQEQLPYTQPQVYGGGGVGPVPQSGSFSSLPTEYRQNTSLYQPLHQPLL